MARQKGTANFSGTLEVLAGGPIDARSVVPTLADLTVAANFPYPYVGLETYVVSENKKYRLIAADVTDSSNWEEIGSGGGSGSGLPDGGTTGQILAKKSSTDGDAEWVDPIQVTMLPNAQDTDVSAVYQYIGETNQYYEHGLTYKISTREGWGKTWTPVNLGVTIMPSPSGYITGDIHQYLGETTQLYTKGYFYQCQLVANAYKWVPIDTQFTNYTKSFDTSEKFRNYTGDSGEVVQYIGENFRYSNVLYERGHFYKFIAAGGWSPSNIEHVDVAALLEKASASTLGGIKVGNNLEIDANGVLSATTPLVANQFDKANIYSTTEKIVGCWIDGRPLYQRTYTGNITVHGGNLQTIASLGSTINVKDVKGCYTCENKLINLVPLSYNGGQNNLMLWYQDNGTLYVDVRDELSPPTPYWITIQYTKTTDAANSFNYADENDYSTSEKRVGTWLDGKPIYQKTVSCGALPNKTTKEVSHGISNLRRAIKIFGYAYYPLDGFCCPLPYSAAGSNFGIEIGVNPTKISITTDEDWSSLTESYITIQYTKTTDV